MTSKIVQREPTQEMCAAASDYAGTLEEHAVMTYANIWRAMYDAAPAMEKPKCVKCETVYSCMEAGHCLKQDQPAEGAPAADTDDLKRMMP